VNRVGRPVGRSQAGDRVDPEGTHELFKRLALPGDELHRGQVKHPGDEIAELLRRERELDFHLWGDPVACAFPGSRDCVGADRHDVEPSAGTTAATETSPPNRQAQRTPAPRCTARRSGTTINRSAISWMVFDEGVRMFVQVIEGRVADRERLRQQMDQWVNELRPGAAGYLGSTGGVADDGQVILFARFDSAESARANSDRPEQGRWWAETEACFDGDVTFTESEDVETFLAGGSNDAGFVQVMKTGGVDRGQAAELDSQMAAVAAEWRPDLIGGFRMWTGPDTAIEANYFTSETEARAGEQKPPPAEFAGDQATFEAMMANTTFIDLRDPWLI
jgi:hypothetical protein